MSVSALWVDQYRTGSASDRVGLALNNTWVSFISQNVGYNNVELNLRQTRSLLLPVLYSSTHDNVRGLGTTTLPNASRHQGNTYPAYLSSTVTAKTKVPISPIIPATMNGTSGVILQSRPPIAAAGVIDRLRTR